MLLYKNVPLTITYNPYLCRISFSCDLAFISVSRSCFKLLLDIIKNKEKIEVKVMEDKSFIELNYNTKELDIIFRCSTCVFDRTRIKLTETDCQNLISQTEFLQSAISKIKSPPISLGLDVIG